MTIFVEPGSGIRLANLNRKIETLSLGKADHDSKTNPQEAARQKANWSFSYSCCSAEALPPRRPQKQSIDAQRWGFF